GTGPWGFPPWALPSTLPCGARTFLPPRCRDRRPSSLLWRTDEYTARERVRVGFDAAAGSDRDEPARAAVPAPVGAWRNQMDAAQPAVEPMVSEPVGAPRHDVTPKRCDRERPRPRRRLARAELRASERLDRGEAFDGRGELHALIRGVRLGTADDALLAGVKDDRRPAAGTRVPGAGAVGVDDDTARGRPLGQASGQADSCQ